ncbi:MAG: DUF2191 domain-containing protein [Propionibacteriaceae bacterium]|jgi:hypothetical protein|nr:DUF2191 domain-containing protein [Propionibacteriaceae bacterium]
MARTTIDLDEAVLAAARGVVEDAARRGERMSLGRAISALALRGLEQTAPTRRTDGFPVLKLDVGHHVVTDALVKQHQDD